MTILVKGLILVVFLVVIFCRDYFPSASLYWATYFLLFALIPLLWKLMFWVSKKQALKMLNPDKIDWDVFVGMVPANEQDDLQRGRLCFSNGKIKLVSKTERSYTVKWEADIKDVKSVSFGKVAGVRKGFTLQFENSDKSFASVKIFKDPDSLYKALGWNVSNS